MIRTEVIIDTLKELKEAEKLIKKVPMAEIFCLEDNKTRFYNHGKKVDEV